MVGANYRRSEVLAMTPREIMAMLPAVRTRMKNEFYLAALAASGNEDQINALLKKLDE